jgi:hypothetical protein
MTEENAAVPSLPVLLAARLLPIAALAVVGGAMAVGPADHTPARAEPSVSTSPSTKAAAAPAYARPPAPCTAVPAGTVKELVPGAKTAGSELRTSDSRRRRGCSWDALKGFDYHWLDVTFEISPTARAARETYGDRKEGAAVPGLGDEASVATHNLKEDGQQTTRTVALVRMKNALITVTYSGSDFETHKALDGKTLRGGALTVVKKALTALDGTTSEDAE